ncbi:MULTISPECIES: hypothetical protein [unclassified Azospirillum]|uniref:hypothetical protein n=1 Tax=unclassified Azospirillum TaxID=2630922 RepID=UPI000B6FEAAE|nr:MULTISPECIES: hypothetical protein [unclassified Azospirillum]SNS46901.1 hypothetical protein SAMN05880556_105112 [Azospirillum sp. RU38E]SNS66068.1 hypothetical protein SAMN05880591_105112 [Azospirillum sp. RU37A]
MAFCDLLPQQPAPLCQRQIALTARHLLPIRKALFQYLLAMRREIDRVLAPQCLPQMGKTYPLGRCLEISMVAFQELERRIAAPVHPVERVLASFAGQGGIIRSIWGALRGRFFQNAMQFGGLYVDVANDTVTITKPKVEIMPLAQSGMEPVRDIAHFAEIAGIYLGAQVYPNLVVPSLAPLLPMIVEVPGHFPTLHCSGDYMVELLMRSGFGLSHDWLQAAPPPPPETLARLATRVPPDLLVADPVAGRAAALQACLAARDHGLTRNASWRAERMRDHQRIQSPLLYPEP